MQHRHGRSFRELIADRFAKRGLYDTPDYWNMKAAQYEGLARSNWPSNAYNEELHALQMQTLERLLGDVTSCAVADVGCGTGRTSLHLARRGARVVGFDFSSGALEAARQDAERAGLAVTFELADVLTPPAQRHISQYDVVLSLGCLCLACSDASDLDRALAHLRALLRPGGRLLLLEPIHRSRLLTRILSSRVSDWIARCSAQGLQLRDRGCLLFVPVRYALAFRDLPSGVVAPVFRAGERLLASASWLEPLSDYKWLLFTAPDVRSDATVPEQ
jgi:2-polyprenyl-3-methyl-5-hydroxy-6-metoxy-1,4-benzoquinol methylase